MMSYDVLPSQATHLHTDDDIAQAQVHHGLQRRDHPNESHQP